MEVVFVHGRSQERRDSAAIIAEWCGSLKQGCGSNRYSKAFWDKVKLPYYGDDLYSFVSRSEASSESIDAKLRAVQYHLDEHEAAASLIDDYMVEASGARLEDRNATHDSDSTLRSTHIERSFATQTDDLQRGMLNWRFVQGMLAGIDKTSAELSAQLINTTLADVGAYLNTKEARDRTDGIVSRCLKSITENPAIIIAHSLGAVVAFRVLHDLAQSNATQRFHLITLGAALPIGGVLKRIKSSGTPISWPGNVISWLNAADPRDVVPLRKRIDRATFFERDSVGRVDVVNFQDIDNRTPNRHGISGYLSDPVVANYIVDLVG